ncbi:hypothetical protein D6833_03380 [Candidatus Parcubacteria bacterium]|nr:MAG: hypothetical protein D6833_03380 [Candidatus Parcubacteria bacterium]
MAGGTLLLLFGGRPQPNAMLAAIEKPERIVVVLSKDTPGEVVAVFRQDMASQVEVHKVPPYQMGEVRQILEHILAQERVQSIGVTGAPLPMAIVAYELGREHNLPVYYVNTGQGEVLDLVHIDRKPLQITLSVRDFLKIYRLRPEPKEKPEFVSSIEQRQQAARFLGKQVAVAGALLTWLRKGAHEQFNRDPLEFEKSWPASFSHRHWRLLFDLQAQGLLALLSKFRHTGEKNPPLPGTRFHIRFPSQGERQFVFGEWLEVYIESVSEECGLLDDVVRGLRFRVREGYREVDFLALRRGIPLLGSCKAARHPWRKEYLDELNAVAGMMGGRYTLRFFFTDQMPPAEEDENRHRAYRQFVDHARRLQIRVVDARELPRWAEVLCAELEDPTYPLI